MPRNNTLARIFRIRKLSENIGSGFHKMFTGWTSYYKRKLVVEVDFDYYKIACYLEQEAESLKKVTQNQEKSNP